MPISSPIPTLLPTDTVPGLAVPATPSSIATLRQHLASLGADPTLPLTWHADAPATILARVPNLTPIAHRAITRLLPGPVTIALELSDAHLASLGTLFPTRAADDGRALWFRAPNHPQTRALLAKTTKPTLARGIPDGTGGLCPTLATARTRLHAAKLPFNDTSTTATDGSGSPSTLLRLPLTGGYHIVRPGALSPELLHARLALNILFVCTGNTCRSPMAQRIAQHLATDLPPGSPPVAIDSAGVSASAGEMTTPQALEALRRLNINPRPTHAKPLTAELIAAADRIYVMTASHLRQAQHAGATNAQLLDPGGADIQDPIGGTQHQYDQTAARMATAIAARLKEPTS